MVYSPAVKWVWLPEWSVCICVTHECLFTPNSQITLLYISPLYIQVKCHWAQQLLLSLPLPSPLCNIFMRWSHLWAFPSINGCISEQNVMGLQVFIPPEGLAPSDNSEEDSRTNRWSAVFSRHFLVLAQLLSRRRWYQNNTWFYPQWKKKKERVE